MLGVLLLYRRLARQQGVALASLAPLRPHPRLLLKHYHQPSIQQMCLLVHQSREVERVPHPRVQSSLTSLPNLLVSHPVRAQLRHLQPHQAPRQQQHHHQPPPLLPRRPTLLPILLQRLRFHHLLSLPCQLVVTPVLQFPRVNCRRVNGQQMTLNVASVKVLILTSGGHVMLTFVIARERLLLVTIA